MNKVLAGDYKDSIIQFTSSIPAIYLGMGKKIPIDKAHVLRYEVAGQETKSGFSVGKAALGAAVFGDVGVIAGANGKNKSLYQVALYFRDGKKSLIEVDDRCYKAITTELFGVEDYRAEDYNAQNAEKKPINKWVAFCLCLFLGFLGAHKFYEKKIGMGILYIFTAGLFVVGWFVDIILILTKPNPYYAK